MKQCAASTDTSVGKTALPLTVLLLLSTSVIFSMFSAAVSAPVPTAVQVPSTQSVNDHLGDPAKRASARTYTRQTPQSTEKQNVVAPQAGRAQLSPLNRILNDADAALKAQEFERALRILSRACSLYKTDPRPATAKAKVLYCLNDIQGSRKILLDVSVAFPRYAPAFAALGRLEEVEGNIAAAEQYYRQSVRLNDRDGDSYFRLAQNALGREDVNDALANVLKCLRCDADNASAHLLLADIYCRRERVIESIDHLKEVLDGSPDNAQILLLTARLQRSLGKTNSALENLRKARELLPEEAMILEEFCLLYGSKNDWVNAREYAEEWTKLEPQNPTAWLVRAWSCRNSQELHDAAAFLKMAVALAPNNPSLHNAYGIVLLDERKADDALREFERARQLEPKDVTARLNAITVFVSGGRWTEATDAARAALVDFPDSAELQGLLAYIRANDGAVQDAEKFAKFALKELPSDANALIALAMLEQKQGHEEQASTYLQSAVNMNPTSPFALIEQAKDFRRKGKTREAVLLLQQVLQLAPSNLRAKAAMAEALKDLGNYQGAILHLKECVVRFPKELDLRLSLADAQAKSGDAQTASETLEKAMKVHPSSPLPLLMLAELALEQKDYARAEVHARNALQFDHRNLKALIVLATVQLHFEKFRDCEDTCQSLLQLGPENTDVLLLSARCAYRQKNWQDGASRFEQVVATGLKLSQPDVLALAVCLEQTGAADKAAALLDNLSSAQFSAADSKELHKLRSRLSHRSL